jgi:hypothetical protein
MYVWLQLTTPKLRELISWDCMLRISFFLCASGPLVSEGPGATIGFVFSTADGWDISSLKTRNKITSLHFTLLYFTRTLPALLQILAVTFAITSGKVPNVTRSHDCVTRLLEVQVVVRLPRYRSHSAQSWDFSAVASQNCSSWPHTTNSTAVPSPPYP